MKAQATDVTFRRCPRDTRWSRRREPWSKAEDDRLLEMFAAVLRAQPGAKVASYKLNSPACVAADALGRTTSAVIARYYVLQVCSKRGACQPKDKRTKKRVKCDNCARWMGYGTPDAHAPAVRRPCPHANLCTNCPTGSAP